MPVINTPPSTIRSIEDLMGEPSLKLGVNPDISVGLRSTGKPAQHYIVPMENKYIDGHDFGGSFGIMIAREIRKEKNYHVLEDVLYVAESEDKVTQRPFDEVYIKPAFVVSDERSGTVATRKDGGKFPNATYEEYKFIPITEEEYASIKTGLTNSPLQGVHDLFMLIAAKNNSFIFDGGKFSMPVDYATVMPSNAQVQ